MLKFLCLLFGLLSSLSCAKVSYLAEQGLGQVALFTSARDNHWVLNDSETPEDIKEKIRQIEDYRRFFVDFWDFRIGRTYGRTTFLDREAVTYLVIASPYNRISPHMNRFPFFGEFPYLGFFKENSALRWAKKLEKQGLVTIVRPVYAYSTLGYFSDPILSSFFHFNEFELAELIFHELFHQLFFIPNEVSLNEALADYFALEMAFLYFDYSLEEQNKWREKREVQKILAKKVVTLTQELNQIYKERELSKDQAEKVLANFLKGEFLPRIESFCQHHQIHKQRCFPLHRQWNNASFVAFLTYHNLSGPIADKHRALDVDIKGLFRHILERYEHYKMQGKGMTFKAFLFK